MVLDCCELPSVPASKKHRSLKSLWKSALRCREDFFSFWLYWFLVVTSLVVVSYVVLMVQISRNRSLVAEVVAFSGSFLLFCAGAWQGSKEIRNRMHVTDDPPSYSKVRKLRASNKLNSTYPLADEKNKDHKDLKLSKDTKVVLVKYKKKEEPLDQALPGYATACKLKDGEAEDEIFYLPSFSAERGSRDGDGRSGDGDSESCLSYVTTV